MEAYIRSNSAHEILKLDGKVPKAVMSAKTSDIIQFCELERFKRVMFQDETAPFLDDLFKVVCYLGPSMDVGPAMTAKILTENRQVFNRSIYLPLTRDQLLDRD